MASKILAVAIGEVDLTVSITNSPPLHMYERISMG